MKKILFLSVAATMLASCGKHTEPKALDLRDDDGDQILNYLEVSEFDKYVSNFQPITSKKAKLNITLKMMSGDLRLIESEIDFNKDMRQELTKNVFRNFHSPFISYESDYYSEIASGKIKEISKTVIPKELSQDGGVIQISFENTDMNNDFISILKKDKGNYKTLFSGRVKESTLFIDQISSQLIATELLNGNEILFSNNPTNKKENIFFEKNLVEDIKSKTYRLILSTDKETNIYYVSKELSIQGFLDLAKVNLTDYKFRSTRERISLYGETEEISLTKVLVPLNFTEEMMNIKLSAGGTFVLFAGKIQEFKKDFFKNLTKQTGEITRIENGHDSFKIKKSKSKEIILDLDLTRTSHVVTPTSQSEHFTSGTTRLPESCQMKLRLISGKRVENVTDILTPTDLGVSFTLDGNTVLPIENNVIRDSENKLKRRLVFNQIGENLEIKMNQTAKTEKVGCVSDGCSLVGHTVMEWFPCKLEEITPEAKLLVNYTAYIE